MEPLQQPYNLFAQQKMAGYPGYQTLQKRTPGQVHGETVGQFAQGKQAANSQTGAVSQPVLPPKGTNQGNGSIKVTDNGTIPAATETGGPRTPVYTGGANNPQGVLDYLTSQFTSPEEEERLRKASIANQRILAVGDALRHIGNIYNTVNYAPAQQFSKPVEEERTRYLQGKAMRDAVNRQYIAYQQAKAAQDAKIAQMQAQNKLRADLNAAQVQNYKDRAAEYVRHNKAIEELNKSKAETAAQNAQRAYEHKVETDKARINIAQQRVNKSGGGRSGSKGSTTGGFTETTRTWKDESGVQHKEHVKTPTGTYDQQKKPNPMGGNNGKKKNPMS